MRTIKFIIWISLINLIIGCQKDSITSDVTEVINPPTQIGTVNIQGTIKNIDGVILRNTEVSVYQDNKKVGTVTSNAEGFYSTKSLPIDPDLDVTLEYKKDDLSIKYRRFTIENSEKIISNPILGKAEAADVTLDEDALVNPSDTNYVKIFGYTKLADGTPVRGVSCRAVWEFLLIGNNQLWEKQSNIDFSDENGYFEILVPKGKIIFLNTFYLRYPEESGQCHLEFQNLENNELIKWRYNKLGIFNNDQEIFLRNDITIELNMVVIKGRALNCDGTPLVTGILSGYIGETLGGYIYTGNSFRDSNYVFGPNGEFEFYLEGCKQENITYGLRVYINAGEFSGRLEKFDLVNTENVGNINLCYDHRDFPDEFTMKLGDDPVKIYTEGGDLPTSGLDQIWTGFGIDDGQFGEDVYFITDNVALGVQPIKTLEMWLSKKQSNNSWLVYEKPFIAKPEDVVLNISKMEGNYVYGSIDGKVDTKSGLKTINITFKIYNK